MMANRGVDVIWIHPNSFNISADADKDNMRVPQSAAHVYSKLNGFWLPYDS